MIHEKLRRFYIDVGLNSEEFWIGAEHPALENVAVELLKPMNNKSILEIGYQAGGFSVPVIIDNMDEPNFRYTGVDNLKYKNAIKGQLIGQFLIEHGVSNNKFCFVEADAIGFILACSDQFDLILLDHVKKLYPKTLRAIMAKRLLRPNGRILIHDVENKASEVWQTCTRISSSFGYTYELIPDVPEGLAVLSPAPNSRYPKISAMLYLGALKLSLALRKLLKK